MITQQILKKNYLIIQFFLLIIGLHLTKKIVTALPVEIPFDLPSLQKIDIQKSEKQKNEYTSEEKHSFTNYKLLRIKPKNEEDIEYLQDLYQSHDSPYELDFWQPPTAIGTLVDVTVSPNDAIAFTEELNGRELDYFVISDDLQRLIEKERPSYYKYHSQSSQDPDELLNYHYDRYNPLSTIEQHLFQLRDENPKLISIIEIGKTYQNRSIYTVKISSPTKFKNLHINNNFNNQTKSIWIDAGIHAREWIAPATAMIILKKLVDGYNNADLEIRRFINQINWYLTIVLNPDGYEYSHTKNRMWRKNRRFNDCKLNRFGDEVCCFGVDLNRNFNWHFSNVGSSSDSCHETYHGPHPFSEEESTAVQKFLQKTHVNAFITLHSYSQLWLIPYAYKKQTYPKNFSTVLKPLSIKATKAIAKIYGTKYSVGTSADLLYEASGTSHDYAQGKLKIPYSFLIELRPQNVMFSSGFLLPESEILNTGNEMWEAMKIIAEEVIIKGNNNTLNKSKNSSTKASITVVKTTQKTTDSSLSEDRENSNISEEQFRKKTHKKNNLLSNKNKLNNKKSANKFKILTNITNELINKSSDHSGIEIVLMIELKRGNKKKIIEFVKEESEKSKNLSSESLTTIDSTSKESEKTTKKTLISKESEKTTKKPLISKFVQLTKATTANKIETKNLKKQKLQKENFNNETTIFSKNKVVTIHNFITTSPPTKISTITTKKIHCYDFSYYCKWWKIHNLCKKPEVMAKCNLSCLPECQI